MKALRRSDRSSRRAWMLGVTAVLLLASRALQGADKTWSGGGLFGDNWSNGGLLSIGGNWSGDPAPTSGDALFFGGSNTTNNNNLAAGTMFVGITFNAGAGAFTLSGNSITLGGNVTNNSSNTQTINLNMILSGTRTFTTNGSGGNLAIGGILSDAGGNHGIVKAGAGTLTLSAANTYTGLTTVNAGTLAYGISNALSTGGVTVDGGTATLALGAFSDSVGIVTVANGGSITGTSGVLTGTGTFEMQSGSVSAILAGAGIALNKTTAGTVSLSGVNTFTGGTTIAAGTLSVGTIGDGGVSGNLGAATNAAENLVFDGGTLQYTGATAGTNRNFTINTGKTAIFDITANNLTLSGASAATDGALTKTGAGTLTLSGANGHTGGTSINNGVLSLGSSGALGSSGTLSFGGGTLQYSAGNTTDYSGRFSTAAGQAYKIDTNGQDVTLAGALTSSGGTFTKSGSGKLTMTSVSNTYSGATAVDDGTLQIDGVLVSAVAVNFGATLSGTGSVSKAITINGVGALRPGNKTPSGSGIGTFTLNGGSGADGNLTVATGATLGMQLGSNGIAFANQATTYYTSPGVLNSAYTTPGNGVVGANDRILVGGTLTVTTGSIVEVTLSGYTPSLGDAFDLFDWTTFAQGTFAIGPGSNIRTGDVTDNASYDLKLPDITAVNSDYRWDVSLFASDGIIVVVPEPSRTLLHAAGLAACFLRRRRKGSHAWQSARSATPV